MLLTLSVTGTLDSCFMLLCAMLARAVHENNNNYDHIAPCAIYEPIWWCNVGLVYYCFFGWKMNNIVTPTCNITWIIYVVAIRYNNQIYM